MYSVPNEIFEPPGPIAAEFKLTTNLAAEDTTATG
jgi:hypothetical protein